MDTQTHNIYKCLKDKTEPHCLTGTQLCPVKPMSNDRVAVGFSKAHLTHLKFLYTNVFVSFYFPRYANTVSAASKSK